MAQYGMTDSEYTEYLANVYADMYGIVSGDDMTVHGHEVRAARITRATLREQRGAGRGARFHPRRLTVSGPLAGSRRGKSHRAYKRAVVAAAIADGTI